MLISTEGNKIYLTGNIYGGDDQVFEHYYSQMESKYSEIDVYLHTNGGDVFAGNYMQNRLKSSSPKINIKVRGTAFSMGGVMLLSGDHRAMARNGWIMLHGSSAGGGTVAEQKETIKVQEGINKNFTKDLISTTGQSEETIKEWLSKDTYFNAEQALEAGLIHEILEPFVELESIDAAASYLQFSAMLTSNKSKQNSNLNTMKQPLITALGLTSVTAESSDTAVIGAVQAHYNAKHTALEQKYNAEKQAHKALKDTIEAEKQVQITAFLEPFKKTHKEEQITAYKTIAETSGLDILKAVLGNATRDTIADIITSQTTTPTAGVKEGWDWDRYQKEDQKGLEALQKSNIEAFKALYKNKFNKEFVI